MLNIETVNHDKVTYFGDWREIYICPECGDYMTVPHNNTFFIKEDFCKVCAHFINKDKWFFSSFYLVRSVTLRSKPFSIFKPNTWFITSHKTELHKDWLENANKYLKVAHKSMVLIKEIDND